MPVEHILPGEIVVDGILLPGQYMTEEAINKIESFKMYPEDTLIATFPRSGTTWVSEIAYLINTDFDFESAKKEYMINRVPFLEEGNPIGSECPIDIAAKMSPPRVMKSHLPFKFFSKHITQDKVKVVVVMRNPKDALVSFFNMYKANKVFGNFPGSWSDYLELFYAKRLAHGDWFEVNNSYWENRDLPNVFIVKYEDLKKDFDNEVHRLAKFMGKSISPENLQKLKEHVGFKAMQDNAYVNPKASHDNSHSRFIRKGEIGDWKNYFTIAQNEQFDLTYMPQVTASGMTFTFT